MDIAAQCELEQLFNKNQLLPRMRREFMDPTICDHCIETEVPYPFALDLLAQMALHKRANVETLVGILHRHFDGQEDPFQACADMLWKAVETDFVDFDTFSEQFIFRHDVGDDVKLELERFQYPLPFVVEPKQVTTNEDTGYFTSKGSIILKQNHHEDDVCLDHINRVNKMKLRINADTARMVKNQWRNLDKPKQGETKEEFEKRVKAFEKYDRVSREVMETIYMTDDDAGFWLTHRYDKRGGPTPKATMSSIRARLGTKPSSSSTRRSWSHHESTHPHQGPPPTTPHGRLVVVLQRQPHLSQLP